MPPRSCFVYVDGSRIDLRKIVGFGTDAVVVRDGCVVLKAPKLRGVLQPDGSINVDEDNFLEVDKMENERNIYLRLCGLSGIAKYIDAIPNGILLEYYGNGSLEDWIARAAKPNKCLRQKWIWEIVDAVSTCHDRQVLINDIDLRNFVLSEDLSIKMIDFGNSFEVPVSLNITSVEMEGCTVKLDILHLANVIYSVITWELFSVSCDEEADWPDPIQMPFTGAIHFDHIISSCWNRQYEHVSEIQRDILHFIKQHSEDRKRVILN